MASQGLRDQLGGGFYRYSVDPGWQIPHFEKMLYDNALLASLYLKAANVFNRNDYELIGREALNFMLDEMKDVDAFIASMSAIDDKDIEGGYYLWTEEELKKLKEVETTLSEQTIPNLMQQAGLSLLKLADGSSVEVKPFYSARIPASKSDEAFDWLRDNGHGDLIKNQVSLEFGMKQDNEAKSIIEELKAKGLPVKQKTSVHPSSLRGFVREQIQDLGKDVPAELFGTYVANKTKITTKE